MYDKDISNTISLILSTSFSVYVLFILLECSTKFETQSTLFSIH